MINELSAYGQISWPLLSTLIWLPIIAAFLMRYFRKPDNAYVFTLVVLVAELAICGTVMLQFVPNHPDVQLAEQAYLVGMNYAVGIDGVSVLFVPWAILLTFLLTVYICLNRQSKMASDYFHYLLLCLGFKLGALLSMDLLLFWLFITAEIYPIGRFIRYFGKGESCADVGKHYSGTMVISSVVMLIGFVLLANQMPADVVSTFSYAALFSNSINQNVQYAIFPIVFFALIMRAPLFPFHTWMPKVIKHGPMLTMSVFLIGINVAIYGLVRFMPLLADAVDEFSNLVALLCLAGVVYGSLVALVQDSLYRLLSYGAIAHLGVIVMAIFSLSAFGLHGSILGALGLAITGVGLFFISDFIHSRINSTEIQGDHSALFRSAPLLTAGLIALVIGNIGFPGTIGFNAEHNIIMGGLSGGWLMLLTVFLSVLLSAGYFLMYFKRTLLDNRPASLADGSYYKDLQPREALIALVFTLLVFLNGLFEPYLALSDSSLEAISSRFESVSTQNYHK
jgi:NADH-quinone oxidoreductase subunit M